MKKIVIFCCFVMFLLVGFYRPSFNYDIVYAETAEEQLSGETNSQLDNLDLSSLEKILNETDTDIVGVFNGLSFKNLVQSIVDGKTTFEFGSFFSSCWNAFSSIFLKLLPFIGLILAIVLLTNLFIKIKPNLAEGNIESVIYFSTFSVSVLIVSHLVASSIVSCSQTIFKMQDQMQSVFPVLLTLMTAAGGDSSVKIYQPAVGILAGGISFVFVSVLLPIVSIMFVLNVVSNLSDNIKLEKFKDLFNSVFKWVIGFIFTVFMAYLAVQGITAATIDGVSIRTAKYAIKNYVPMLGGYISDGFEVVMASSMLLKNGIGLATLFLLLATILIPLFSIVILSFALKLVSALTEPISDKKFSSFLLGVSKVLNMLIVVLLGCGLMYFLSIALIISTANSIL